MAGEKQSLPDSIETVAIGVGDLNGIMRGKRVTREQWDSVCAVSYTHLTLPTKRIV